MIYLILKITYSLALAGLKYAKIMSSFLCKKERGDLLAFRIQVKETGGANIKYELIRIFC